MPYLVKNVNHKKKFPAEFLSFLRTRHWSLGKSRANQNYTLRALRFYGVPRRGLSGW
jgi:hypothetical protein